MELTEIKNILIGLSNKITNFFKNFNIIKPKDFTIYKPTKKFTGSCLGVRLQKLWVDTKDPNNPKYNIGSVKLTITNQSGEKSFKGDQIERFKLTSIELCELILAFKHKTSNIKFIHTYNDEKTKVDVITTLTNSYSKLDNGCEYYGLQLNQTNGDRKISVRISLTPPEVYALIILFEKAIPIIWGWENA